MWDGDYSPPGSWGWIRARRESVRRDPAGRSAHRQRSGCASRSAGYDARFRFPVSQDAGESAEGENVGGDPPCHDHAPLLPRFGSVSRRPRRWFADRLHGHLSRHPIEGVSILVASLADIIRSKKAARRPRDLAVIDVLEKSLEERDRSEKETRRRRSPRPRRRGIQREG